MEDELNTMPEGGSGSPAEAVAEPDESLSAVVGELWQDTAEESVTEPEVTESETEETPAEEAKAGPEATEDAEKPAEPPKPPEPNYYTAEEIAADDFDMAKADLSRVPPHTLAEYKRWQAAATRKLQKLSEREKQSTTTQQPEPKAQESSLYSNEELNEILNSTPFKAAVEKYLADRGINLDVVAKESQETLFSAAVAPVIQKYPELKDEDFIADVRLVISQDQDLLADSESDDPKLNAKALRTAAAEVRARRLENREKSRVDSDAKLAKEAEELRLKKEAANRQKSAASKAALSRKAPPASKGDGSLREDVDALFEDNPDFSRAFSR